MLPPDGTNVIHFKILALNLSASTKTSTLSKALQTASVYKLHYLPCLATVIAFWAAAKENDEGGNSCKFGGK